MKGQNANMSRLAALCLLAPVWLLMAGRSDARPVPVLSFEELFKDAEVVVVANAVSTADAGKDIKNKKNDEYRVAILTTLNVIQAVKGEHKDAKLVVFHYRFTKRRRGLVNGPCYINFDTSKEKAINIKTGKEEEISGSFST